MAELTTELNRLAGTTGLEAQGAANAWAGTDGLALVGALNVVRGNSYELYQDLQGVLNQLAETSGLGVNEAASLIDVTRLSPDTDVYPDVDLFPAYLGE